MVHREQLLHRAVHGLFNPEGQLFLQRRSMHRTSTGKWYPVPAMWIAERIREARVNYRGNSLIVPEPLEPVFKSPLVRRPGMGLSGSPLRGRRSIHPDPMKSAGKWLEVEALNRWMQQCPRDFARSCSFVGEVSAVASDAQTEEYFT